MMWRSDRWPQNVAVVDDRSQSLTYRQLWREGRLLTEATDGRCLVFCLCGNTLGSLLGYTAFLNSGIVPLMLSASLDGELLQSLYDTYHPRYLWTPVAFEREDCACVYERFGYHLLNTPFTDNPRLAHDLALLLTTSGSTGSPKLVRQTYRNLRANTESIVSYLGLDASEKPITTLPMNYTYGLSILNSHLDVGATILLTDRSIAQKEFWRFFRDQGATSFGGVPYTYEMLDRMRFTRMELPTLRTLTQAGGKLSPELQRKYGEWCRDTGRKLVVMYGQCEATARMGYLPWESCLDKLGSMGVAIPGGSFELIDAHGGVIDAPGVAGELRYRGENVTPGYAERASDLAKGDERQGVLDTGDMAARDEAGFYAIVGRKKRFVKLFGNRVNLDETERLLRARFPKADCACVGTDDHLLTYATDERALTEMRDYLAEKTGLNPAGFIMRHIAAIPRNESGKTLYAELDNH